MSYSHSKRQILRISIITLIINIIVTTLKVLGGVFGHSETMISDANHSLFDTLSTMLVILSVYMMHVSTDKKEQRHNQIIQGICSLILAVILFFTCNSICSKNIDHIINKDYLHYEDPAWFELAIAVFAISTKEVIFYANYRMAKRLNYPPLEANAWHQRLDSMTSFGTILSILLIRIFDLKIADNIIAILISLFLFFIVFEDFIIAIEKITGKHAAHYRKNRHTHIIHTHSRKDDLLLSQPLAMDGDLEEIEITPDDDGSDAFSPD